MPHSAIRAVPTGEAAGRGNDGEPAKKTADGKKGWRAGEAGQVGASVASSGEASAGAASEPRGGEPPSGEQTASGG